HDDDDSRFAVARRIRDLGVNLYIANRNIHPLRFDRCVREGRFRRIKSGEITVSLAVETSDGAAALSTTSAFAALRFAHSHQTDVVTSVVVWRERDECRMIVELRIDEVDRSRPSLLRIFEFGTAHVDLIVTVESHARDLSI